MNWQKYTEDKVFFKHEDGFLVIKPKNCRLIPLICPKCSKPLNKANDIEKFHENYCCFSCFSLSTLKDLTDWKQKYDKI